MSLIGDEGFGSALSLINASLADMPDLHLELSQNDITIEYAVFAPGPLVGIARNFFGASPAKHYPYVRYCELFVVKSINPCPLEALRPGDGLHIHKYVHRQFIVVQGFPKIRVVLVMSLCAERFRT